MNQAVQVHRYGQSTSVPYADLYDSELRIKGFPANGNQKSVAISYSRLFDGQPHRLVVGVDFQGSLKYARSLIYQAAQRRQINVSVALCGEGLVVQASPKMGVPNRHRDFVRAVRQFVAAVDQYAQQKSKIRHHVLLQARTELDRALDFEARMDNQTDNQPANQTEDR